MYERKDIRYCQINKFQAVKDKMKLGQSLFQEYKRTTLKDDFYTESKLNIDLDENSYINIKKHNDTTQSQFQIEKSVNNDIIYEKSRPKSDADQITQINQANNSVYEILSMTKVTQ